MTTLSDHQYARIRAAVCVIINEEYAGVMAEHDDTVVDAIMAAIVDGMDDE